MSLDISKLVNVNQQGDKIIAQCPACAAEGHDKGKNHLVVFSSGAYACAKYPDDKAHRKAIFKLAGVSGKAGKGSSSRDKDEPKLPERIPIKPYAIPDSYVIMEIPKYHDAVDE